MNLDRRPVNEERACGAALGGSACRSPRTRDDAPLQRRCPARSEQNTSSIFSPGTEKGWLGLARLGLARAASPRCVCRSLLRSPSSAADVAQPPPRSHELCRLRPLTANICCGCLLQAAWKQSWGERSSFGRADNSLCINCSEI